MFDNYRIGRDGPSHVSIKADYTEKRAPTDESVRLLQEMEQKALERIVLRADMKDNGIEATGTVFGPSTTRLDHELVVAFKLNGRQHIVRTEISVAMLQSKHEIAETILRLFAGRLAEELLSQWKGQ